MQAIPQAQDCCLPCDDPITTNIPGPTGATGAAGVDGTDGENAYTTLTAAFTMPAELANGVADVASSDWMTVGQIVFVQFLGFLEVISKPTATSVTLKNLEDAATSAYLSNSPAATVAPIGSTISPSGLQGPAGTSGASGAPDTASYWTRVAEAGLSGESDMSALATGYVKVTTGTGAPSSQAVPIPVADGGTGGITAATARAALFAAPLAATYWTRTADGELSAESDMSALATGYVKVTTGTGAPSSQAVPIPIADGGTGGVTAAAARTALGVNRTLQDYLLYQHQLATTVNAGDFTSGSWQTVPLNTEVADTGAHGSIAANAVTLAQGTYRVRWRVCGFQVGNFQSRLFNVTTAGVVGLGSNASSAAADSVANYSHGEARITIAAATEVVRLEAQCQTTNAGDGFGVANSFGGTEVYASFELEREANT